jgi:hypothetical protein
MTLRSVVFTHIEHSKLPDKHKDNLSVISCWYATKRKVIVIDLM